MPYNNPLKLSFWQNLIDKKIGRTVKLIAYFKQSIMATITMLVFFLTWHYFSPIHNQVIFSAIASSTFLTFISTNIYDSLARKIIGGQVIGILVGIGLWRLMHYFSAHFPAQENEIYIIFLSLSAGLSLFFMAIFNMEHPPGAGTAMAFVFKPLSPVTNDVMFILICASILAIVHTLLKKHQIIKDLEGRDARTELLRTIPKHSQTLKK